ncbi:MAG: membrane-binding protein [Reichenbachiella sp.]|uniref:toxin-antitoxin system YwqK family antitoxin n=1 Tax=Reichenbachiella sp. TaxID=2184521 RepID=UPI003296BA0E
MRYAQILILALLVGCDGQLKNAKSILSESKIVDIPLVTYELQEVFFNKKSSRWQFRVNNALVSGYIVDRFKNGQDAKQISVYEGRKEGTLKTYFPNGQLKYEENYKNNKLHGEVKRWSQQSGYQLMAHLNYKDGKLHGEQKKWFVTGELHKLMHMKEGKEDGIQQAFRKNGKLYANYESKNGRVFGLKRSNLCYELDDQQVVYKD